MEVGSKEGQGALVGGVHDVAAENVVLACVNLDFAGEISELAEADELAGVHDRNLLIELAMEDEQRGQALNLGCLLYTSPPRAGSSVPQHR